MKKIRELICALLLITTPTLLAQGARIQACSNQTGKHLPKNAKKKERYHLLTYDDILYILNEIETGEIEKYREKDILRVNEFLVYLVKEGALPNSSNQVAMQQDINCLLGESSYEFAFIPPIASEAEGCYQQVGLFSKPWKKTKAFCKKYKNEIIIGAVIVVAAATIVAVVAVSASAAAASAATAAGGAAASTATRKERETDALPNSSVETSIAPHLEEMVTTQVDSFKDFLASEPLFPSTDSSIGELSMAETGRVLGHLFVNESVANIQSQTNYSPHLAEEINQLSHTSQFAFTGTDGEVIDFTPAHANDPFMQGRDPLALSSYTGADFATLSYYGLGETAFQNGYYEQAVQEFGKVIKRSPEDPSPYLGRSASYFQMGDYERSIEDYQNFVRQKGDDLKLIDPEFREGFNKGLGEGLCHSSKNLLTFFLVDLNYNPVQTVVETWGAFTTLCKLGASGDWDLLAQTLVPEVYQLVKEWDSLSEQARGQLAGADFGKFGVDIFLPAAVTKTIAQGTKGAQQLVKVAEQLQAAEKTALFESIATIENSAQIGEMIQAGHQTLFLAEELGFSAQELGHLKKAGTLETTITNAYEQILKEPAKRTSIELYKDAARMLKPYQGKYMPEMDIRALIESAGIRTFPRPKGIPDNFRVKLSKKGAGMKYVHPTDTGTYVRVMPGKPHSPFPYQHRPYVNQRVKGKSLDKYGNVVLNESPESHILLEEFVFKDIQK